MESSKNIEKLPFIGDNPSKNDKFGFDAYVDILEASITVTESLPFIVGIFGDWGTGKTTLMGLLEGKFKHKEGYKTIWINPWKYDTREDIRKALIASILLELKKIYTDDKSELISTLLKDTAWIAAEKGITYLSGGLLAGSIDNVKKKITEDKQKELEFFNQFEKQFEELIIKLVGENGRLIIFIDDLDRCIPENSVVILESLKLFLNEPHCIFVLGMDRKIVEQAIKFRYKELPDFSGTDYLDKIIQLPFFIPPIQYEKLDGYLKESTKLVSDYNDNIWSLIDFGFGGNPRKVKRFVNCYYLLQKALESRKILEQNYNKELVEDFNNYSEEDKLFFLAKILIIRMRYPEFYDFLISDNKALEYYEEAIHDSTVEIHSESKPLKPTKFVDQAKRVLGEYPDLKSFWEMRDLRRFLYDTCCGTNGFPQMPSSHIIEYLLLLTSFVEGGKSKPIEKHEQTEFNFGKDSGNKLSGDPHFYSFKSNSTVTDRKSKK